MTATSLAFDWLWKKAAPIDPPSVDRVWRDLAERDRALVREVQNPDLVVLAFFEATAAHLGSFIEPARGVA